MTQARREFSAGGVVYKSTGDIVWVILIARKNKTIWCLPKGKIEKKESFSEAAAREIKEEAGITAKLVKTLGNIAYYYVSPIDKAQIFKQVRFFLFKYLNGSIQEHDDEAEQVKWFKPPEALKIMSYVSERDIMKKALKQIEVHKM